MSKNLHEISLAASRRLPPEYLILGAPYRRRSKQPRNAAKCCTFA